MRKVIMFNMISLDGLFEGPGHDLSWHNTDEDFMHMAIDQLDEGGALLFGRATYEMMAEFWPSPAGVKDDPETAVRMNRMPKYVFSRTLPKAGWTNTTLISGDAAEAVRALKEQPGKPLLLFGSANLAVSLVQHNLIDEFRLVINPLVLGSGTPLFQGLSQPLKLKLIESKTYANGNVLLKYANGV